MAIRLYEMNRIMTCLFVMLIFTNNSWSNETEPKIQMDTYNDSIHTLLKSAELEKATDYAISYLSLTKKEFSEEDYLSSLALLFRCYRRQSKYSEALLFLQNEFEWASENQKQVIQATIKFYLGILFKKLNENEKAIEYFLDVKESLEEELADEMTVYDLSLSKIRINRNLGDIMIFSDPERTLEYFETTKLLAQSIDDSISLGDSYLNIGWAYVEIEKYEFAELYLDSALVIYKEIESVNGKVSVFLERGIILENKGSFKEALGYYLKSYNLLFNENQYKYKSYFLKQKTLTLISDLYTKQNLLDSALMYAHEKLDFVEGYKDRKNIAQVSNKIAKIYEVNNNEKAALKYYKLSNDNYEILKFEDARINVLKKEKAYNDKRTTAEVHGLKSILKSKNKILVFFAFSLLGLGFVSFFIIKSTRKKELEAAQKLKIKEDIIYKKTQSMAQLSLINQSKIQFIDYFKEKLQSIYNDSAYKSPEIKNLISKLKRSSNNEEEWERFRKYYMELEPSFYKEIQKKYPRLTNLDIRHCILLKLKMSNNEAAEVLGVSPKSIQMARYRLKKKLNCDSQFSLKQYLDSI